MAYKKLSPEDLKRFRETDVRYEAARAGAHVYPAQYEAASAAQWRLWEEIFEKYDLDEAGNHGVARTTGVILREKDPAFEPVEDGG